jgi:hypothetical protein
LRAQELGSKAPKLWRAYEAALVVVNLEATEVVHSQKLPVKRRKKRDEE